VVSPGNMENDTSKSCPAPTGTCFKSLEGENILPRYQTEISSVIPKTKEVQTMTDIIDEQYVQEFKNSEQMEMENGSDCMFLLSFLPVTKQLSPMENLDFRMKCSKVSRSNCLLPKYQEHLPSAPQLPTFFPLLITFSINNV
jgi:hypothetical protein